MRFILSLIMVCIFLVPSYILTDMLFKQRILPISLWHSFNLQLKNILLSLKRIKPIEFYSKVIYFNHNYRKENTEFIRRMSYIYFLTHTIKFHYKIITFYCVLDDGPKHQQKDDNFLLNVTRLFQRDISFLITSTCFRSLRRAKTQNMQLSSLKPHDSCPALSILQ